MYGMRWTKDDYERLGDKLRAARRAKGFLNLKAFQDFLDSGDAFTGEQKPLSGRTYADIENGRLGKRRQFSTDSLAFLEEYFGWYAGASRAILNGNFIDPITGAQVVVADGAQRAEGRDGGVIEDGDTLLFKRPEGLSDEEWAILKTRGRDHWEWEISRAAQER